MKTKTQRFVEGRTFLILTGLSYLALTGLLLYVLGVRTKPEIEAMLIRLIPKLLWVNFSLIAAGVLICRREIIEAFHGLFAVYTIPMAPVEEGRTGPSGDPAPSEAVDPGCAPPSTVVSKGCVAPRSAMTSEDRVTPAGFLSRAARLNRPGVWLLLVVIVGGLLVTQVAPQIHRIYYDEDIYANMAQNIAYTGQAGMANYGTFEYGEYFVNWLSYNKDPAGWPFLIGLVFQLFGTDESLAFYLNNLLFAGGILVVFFIARIVAGAGIFPALLAALVYALIPHNAIWANTAAAENAAALFAGLAVLCTLVWLRTRETRHLFLLMAVLPFACHMRPESVLITIWALAAAGLNLFSYNRPPAAASPDPGPPSRVLFRHPLLERRFWAMGLIAYALALPLVWHFWAMSGQSWGAQGPKFSAAFFTSNLAVNGLYFLNNREFPVLFTLLALVGLAAGMARPKREGGRTALLMLPWFLLFWGIFLFFYAGSYKYGADVRFALVCFMPISILAGFGGGVLRVWLEGLLSNRIPVAALLVLLLLISWLKFIPLIRTEGQEAWGARYDHRYAREFIRKIPNRAIVLTHIPTMFLLWGQNAIQAYAGINNPELIRDLMIRYNGHVYFHKSYWCNAADDANRSVCEGIVQRYDLDPVAVAREQSHDYGLYRMTFKSLK